MQTNEGSSVLRFYADSRAFDALVVVEAHVLFYPQQLLRAVMMSLHDELLGSTERQTRPVLPTHGI